MDLQISKGPDLVVVPKVTDLQLDQARQALEALGLVVDAQGFGTVRQQDPGPGSQVPPGTHVRLLAFF
jgi:beta-lactam-binding protein with PASTA domain